MSPSRLRRGLTAGAGILSFALGAALARAADSIMPLEQVQRGMRCTGLSVVRGTDVSSFDVEVPDVVSGGVLGGGPRILFRASGPAVDRTGIGQGFSGSPILCPTADGTVANAGAISEGVGEYGNEMGLATPIQQFESPRLRVTGRASVPVRVVRPTSRRARERRDG